MGFLAGATASAATAADGVRFLEERRPLTPPLAALEAGEVSASDSSSEELLVVDFISFHGGGRGWEGVEKG